jgi:hypothetical protein
LLEVAVTDVGVVLYQLVYLLIAVSIEVLHELLSFHQLMGLEVDRADNFSIFDALNLLLDVGSMVEDSLLHFLEFIDLHLALFNVLVDRKTEPVVISGSLLHLEVQLV